MQRRNDCKAPSGGGTLSYLVHESREEDEQRTQINHSTEMEGATQYGRPGKKPPLWLHGRAARAAIATADAATRSLREDRKVKIEEIIG